MLTQVMELKVRITRLQEELMHLGEEQHLEREALAESYRRVGFAFGSDCANNKVIRSSEIGKKMTVAGVSSHHKTSFVFALGRADAF